MRPGIAAGRRRRPSGIRTRSVSPSPVSARTGSCREELGEELLDLVAPLELLRVDRRRRVIGERRGDLRERQALAEPRTEPRDRAMATCASHAPQNVCRGRHAVAAVAVTLHDARKTILSAEQRVQLGKNGRLDFEIRRVPRRARRRARRGKWLTYERPVVGEHLFFLLSARLVPPALPHLEGHPPQPPLSRS